MLMANGLEITYEDIKEERESGKMLLSAENCKKNLSKSEKASFKLVYKRKQYVKEISRSLFEELTEHLLDRTIDIIQHAKKISLDPNAKIDEVILVGGSSYMPMVKERLQKEFSCPIRLDNLEPDRAIAKGAALHATNLVGNKGAGVEIGKDLASRSYGVRCLNDKDELHVVNMVKRTDEIVYQGNHEFCTSVENQESVCIAIYENISEAPSVALNKCTLIEEKSITWGFPVPKGTPVMVYVSRSSDGTVRIWGECQNKRADFTIQYKGMYSEAEVEKLRKELEQKRV